VLLLRIQRVPGFGERAHDHRAPRRATGFSAASAANGINNAGDIVGAFADDEGTQRGFVLSGGTYTIVDAPEATATAASGINAAGEIVGDFTDAGGTFHGFLLSGTTFTAIDVPGASASAANAINDAGEIVGWFLDTTGTHGFLLSGGTFTTLDVPGATTPWRGGIGTDRDAACDGLKRPPGGQRIRAARRLHAGGGNVLVLNSTSLSVAPLFGEPGPQLPFAEASGPREEGRSSYLNLYVIRPRVRS